MTVASYADIISSIFAMVVSTVQTLFMLYHLNSYANNPAMLRSSKPMVMRDIFLTRPATNIPNPLSCVYVSTVSDCIVNCVCTWLFVKPIVSVVGWRSGTVIYMGSGFFSAFAYLFGAQVNKKKLNTQFDCACTSNGAMAGFAALTLAFPKTYIPFSRRVPIVYAGVPYLLKCTYDEYIWPRYVQKRKPGDIELRNWGFIGGAFFGLIYGSLAFRTKADFSLLRRFTRNMRGPSGGTTGGGSV